jgi:hypothetical protein
MTIELTRKHWILGGCLFVTQFVGLWITMYRSPWLHDFANHIGPGGLAFWLIPLCAGSAFLNAVILVEVFSVFTKSH